MADIKMKSVILDGIEYNADQEVINAYSKANVKATGLETKSSELQAKLDELTAKHDSLKQEHEELKTHDTEKEIIAASKNRITLLTSIKDVFNDEEMKTVQDSSERKIKEAVLNKLIKNKISLDDKSIDYINARFDAEIEKIGDSKFANQRKVIKGNEIIGDSKDVVSTAYQGMCNRLYNPKSNNKSVN